MIIRVTSRSSNPLSTDLGTLTAGQVRQADVPPNQAYEMAKNLTIFVTAGLLLVETFNDPDIVDELEPATIEGGSSGGGGDDSEVPLADVSGQHILTAGDMSVTIAGPAIDVRRHDAGTLTLKWTGTPTGTFVIQCSLDYDPDVPLGPAEWDTLTASGTATAAGSADRAFYDLLAIDFPFLRVLYTASSGTGSLDIWFAGKNDS